MTVGPTDTVEKGAHYTRPHNRLARVINVMALASCIASAGAAILALVLITGYIFFKGFSALNLSFFIHSAPDGILNGIVGTVILIALSSIIGVPLGMLAGIYLSEYSRGGWFSTTVRLIVDVLAGTPSIIVGILFYLICVVPMHSHSGMAGAFALAFIMIPIVCRTTEEMLRLVPLGHREASVGLGANEYQTLLRVVLPAARSGIITGVMLAVARVAGETAPLLFTVGGFDSLVLNPRKQFPALTLQIWQKTQEFDPQTVNQAWAGILVLVSIILALNAAVRYTSRGKRPGGTK